MLSSTPPSMIFKRDNIEDAYTTPPVNQRLLKTDFQARLMTTHMLARKDLSVDTITALNNRYQPARDAAVPEKATGTEIRKAAQAYKTSALGEVSLESRTWSE